MKSKPDLVLARKLTELEEAAGKKAEHRKSKNELRTSKVIGFTGPGGAGKTTLIDELVLRFLQRDAKRVSQSSRTIRASSAKARCSAIAPP